MAEHRLKVDNRESHENLELIFNANPDAVMITRMEDSCFVRINDSFSRLTGYTQADVTGKTSLEINLWRHPEERGQVVRLLTEKGVCENLEFIFLRKDHSQIYGMFSARRIHLQGVPHIISVVRDISERKRVEIALHESEEKLRTMIDEAQEGILLVDEQGTIIEWNRANEQLTGVTRADAIRQPAWIIQHRLMSSERRAQFSPDSIKKLLLPLLSNEYPSPISQPIEAMIETPSGETKIFLQHSFRIKTDKGFRLASFAHDITDRKKAEKAMQESEARFRQIVETAIEGIFSLDKDLRIVFVNQQMAVMLGYRVDEMLGQIFESFLPEDQLSDHAKKMVERRKGQDAVYERCFKMKSGERHWLLVSAKAIMDAQGQFNGSFAMFTDIHEHKLAQERIQESEARYRRFVETAIEGILSLDNNRRITFANQQMAAMLGYSVDEMIGKKYESFMPEDQLSEDEAQKKIRAQGQDAVYERCFLNKNGQRHWTLVSAKSVLDSDGKFVSSFGMFTDINERKQLEAKLQQQASTDELTGLSNRRHFLDLASLELKRASRFKHPISLALFDIDHFKLINDRHGHAAGDHALRFLAKICQENIRELDIFARFGGDEFALLLPETNALLAYKVLERIRLNVNAQPILLDNIPVYFCISMGLACLEEKNVPLDILLARADQALYQAKEGGRNRVFLEIQPGSEDL